MTTNRPILVIDGFNLFIKMYMGDPSITNSGMLCGGVVGTLRNIGRLVEELSPSCVYICWELGGGSGRRNKIFEGYKQNRTKDKETFKEIKKETSFNKWAKTDQDNKAQQLSILINVLKNLPVCQLYVQGVEGDDICSYLVKYKFKTLPNKKIIASSDKDFYQLLDDDNVNIYDLSKKILIYKDKVTELFDITPNNFAAAKALVGDQSDGIPGIQGLGFKTLAKKFPELKNNDKDYLISEIIDLAKQKQIEQPKIKIFGEIVDNADIIKRNWKLVNLDSSALSLDQIKKIDYAVDNFIPKINKLEMIKGLMINGIVSDIDYDRMCSNMRRILM